MSKTSRFRLILLTLLILIVLYSVGFTGCKIQMEQFTKRIIDNDLVIIGDGTLDDTGVSNSDIQPVKQIIINGTTHVADGLFSDKTWIRQFNLNDNVTFGARCFSRTGITSFVFPLAMTMIPDRTFDGCSSLTSIIFPSNCISIGIQVFQNISHNIDFYYYGTTKPTTPSLFPNNDKIRVHCTKFTGVFIDGSASQDNRIEGELNFHFGTFFFSNDTYAHIKVSGNFSHSFWFAQIYRSPPVPTLTVILYSSNLTLGSRWFIDAPQMTNLTLFSTGMITLIEYSFAYSLVLSEMRFYGNGTYSLGLRGLQQTPVTHVEFGECVDTIGEAFCDTCLSLKYCKFLGFVIIRRWAFIKCGVLNTLVYCGKNVTTTHDISGIFAGNVSYAPPPLEYVQVTTDFDGNDFIGKKLNRSASTAYNADRSVKFNYTRISVEISGSGLIPKSEVERPSIPKECRICDDKLQLREITLSSDNLIIGNNAFEDCVNLARVNVRHVTTFNDRSFRSCTSLTKVFYCASAVSTISQTSFENTPSSLRVYVPYAYSPNTFGPVNVKFTKILNSECSLQSLPFSYSHDFSPSSLFVSTNEHIRSGYFTRSNHLTNSEQFTSSTRFTLSNEMSKSTHFTRSNRMTKSNAFTNSKKFSKSNDFKQSNQFSITKIFSVSSYFSRSRPMTSSEIFTNTTLFYMTSQMSESNFLTKSENFTGSNHFIRSEYMSKSAHFTLSEQMNSSKLFSLSNLLEKSSSFSRSNFYSNSANMIDSNYFTNSENLSLSVQFTRSDYFSSSVHFSLSNIASESLHFSKTEQMIETNAFSITYNFSLTHQMTGSTQFSRTHNFSASMHFTQSDFYDKSHHFTPSSKFTQSSMMTQSFDFSKTGMMSKSNIYSVSTVFVKTKVFSLSMRMTQSIKMSESTHFTRSAHFTHSNQFTPSSMFTPSDHLDQSHRFSPSSTFTKSNPYTMSTMFTESNHFTFSVLNTYMFTGSSKMSGSNYFSKSSKFAKTGKFTRTDSMTQTNHFSRSSEFSQSNDLMATKTFSATKEFLRTSIFSLTRQFIQSSNLSESGVFTASKTMNFHNDDQKAPDSLVFNKPKKVWNVGILAGMIIGLILIALLIMGALIYLSKRRNIDPDDDEDGDMETRDESTFISNQLRTMINPLYDGELDPDPDPFEFDFAEGGSVFQGGINL